MSTATEIGALEGQMPFGTQQDKLKSKVGLDDLVPFAPPAQLVGQTQGLLII